METAINCKINSNRPQRIPARDLKGVEAAVKSVLVRVWGSPTFMTWGSLLSKSLSLVIVLPLLLTRFQAPEIALWYLLMSILALQSVVDAGFSPTFSRVIAYIKGGVKIDDLESPTKSGTGILDPRDLNQVYSTMKKVYFRLGFIWTGLLLILGTLALRKPIHAVQDPRSAWIAWAVILSVSSISFQAERYSAYLQGLNYIALLRRWETVAAVGGIVTSFMVLLLGGNLLGLVVANQAWQLFNVARNRWLARSVEGGIMRSFDKEPLNKAVFAITWHSAWRSGLGLLLGYGATQASGIIYAQVGDTADVASYLLGLRFMQVLAAFSYAPFMSKIPYFARLYAEGRMDDLVCIAQRGMRLTYWSYVAAFSGIAILVEPFLKTIGSHASFPNPLLWTFMGMATFVERFGAMHLQLYSTTNRIIWHIANGVSGVIYLAVSIALVGAIGAYSFPIGSLAASLGFYCWYSAIHSYNTFGLSPLTFEKECFVAPFLVLIVCSAVFVTLGI